LLSRGSIEGFNGRDDAPIPLALGDLEMEVPERRDLREVSDD
jgi:hypothetical protein